MTSGNGADWTREFLAASQVADMAKDPDDFRVTRQSKVTIGGLLVPVGDKDMWRLKGLFSDCEAAYHLYGDGYHKAATEYNLTATMLAMMKRSAHRAKGAAPDFDHISLDPRDYTVFTAPGVEVPVVSIHTRPERCWFLGILKFESALGLSLGRMRVMRPTDKGMYPVTIRTKWRALTNKVKQEEVRDAYQRLIAPPA